MAGVIGTYVLLATLVAVHQTTNLIVVDPSNQIDMTADIHNKTDICNALKRKDLASLSFFYIVEKTSEESVSYFHKKLASMNREGTDLHVKQFIIKNSQMDTDSFALCLQTVKNSPVTISGASNSEIDEVLANNTSSNSNSIILFEDATSGSFEYRARIMSEKHDADQHDGNSHEDHVDVNQELFGNEDKEDDQEAHPEDKPNISKENKQSKINLGPSGLMGVALAVTFILVLIIYFNLMLSSANFNPKFIKEKLPQGREY